MFDNQLTRWFTPRRSFIAIVVVALLIQLFNLFVLNHFEDWFIYRTGVCLGLAGRSPYESEPLKQKVDAQFDDDGLTQDCGFFLLPQAVPLFASLAVLPWTLSKLAFVIVSLSLSAWGIYLTRPKRERGSGVASLTHRPSDGASLTHRPSDGASLTHRPGWGVTVIAAALFLAPIVVTGLRVGQTTLLVLGCILLGQVAHTRNRPWLAALLWAVPFIKPHIALPLVPLALYLGGWRRLIRLGLIVLLLNLLGSLIATGSYDLLFDYVKKLPDRHKEVSFNKVEFNPQITSWNRTFYSLGGPLLELSIATTLAGYTVWGLLILARVWLFSPLTPGPSPLGGEGRKSRTPTPAWCLAVTGLGILLCAQVLAYELALLGLLGPYLLELAGQRRWRILTLILIALAFTAIPFEARQIISQDYWPSHRAYGVMALSLLVLGSFRRLPQ